ncbi:MAG: sigma-70 family RNA polymerase sigma factor [Kiritimatiellaeota bacterium]|nr:sigma-70 family RNA polymerase sigma factor [Kiritimatiellota bacterium]
MDLNEASDGCLIEAYRSGNEKAFEALYNRYRRQLFSYLNRVLPGRGALVDDLYQQTWLRIIESLPAYREEQKFLSWAFRIAHNLAVDNFRREARREEVEIDERIADETDPPWSRMDREALKGLLAEAIQDLPEDQREVLLLRQQGIAFKEIARIQGVSINTVLGRMHYAVRKLRRALADSG